MPSVDLNIQQQLKKRSKHIPAWMIVKNYLEQHFGVKVLLFTDGLKDQETGCKGAVVFIPQWDVAIKKRVTDFLSVYTVEFVVILPALLWVEENNKNNAVIASDNWAALTSIKSGKSCRLELVVYKIMYKLYKKELTVCFIWVPAHVGVKANEDVNNMAK